MQDTINPAFPPSEPAKRRRSRRFWQVAIGLSILVVAFAVFAWQQGGDGDSGGPLNAIAEAAEKTQQEPGGRAVMHSLVTVPGKSESFTLTGHMIYNSEDRAQAVITAPHTATGGPMKMDVVGDGTVMYMRSSQLGSLPDGAEWMRLDLALGDDLESPVPANVDAKGELALLEAVGGDVRKLGKEEVRGVPTTRYGGTLSAADQIERLQEEGADSLSSVTKKVGSPVQVEAWIDAEGLVRRMRLVSSQPSPKGDGTVTVDTRMDFFDFGIEPEIEVPDSSEVFDATDVTREQLGAGD